MSIVAVLDQIKSMKHGDLIAKTLQSYFRKSGVPIEKGIMAVQKEVAEGTKLIPFETSVLAIKPLGGDVAQIHFFTLGTAKDLVDDMQFFYKYMKDNGISTIYDTVPNNITTAGLQRLGAQIMQSDNPKYKFKAII